LRLDAAARYLQDLSDDDTRDAGLAQMTWVVRRTVIDVHQFPTYLEPVEMITWCSAIGSRWAERRVDIGGGGGDAVSISSATLWVHLDSETLRPVPTSAAFELVFAQSAAGRTVSSRLTLDAPPADLVRSPWPVRFSDFDVMDHMNNAIAFVLVEEVLARRRDLRAPLRVEVEYRSPIDRDVALHVGGLDVPDALGTHDVSGYDGWLLDDQARCQTAFRIRPLPTVPARVRRVPQSQPLANRP
jgi:acyl-ACP thioesterase